MLNLTSADLKKTRIETLLIPVCEDERIHDHHIVTALADKAKKYREFSGKSGERLVLYDLPELGPGRAVFSGVGKFEKIDAETLRACAGREIKKAISNNLTEILIVVPSENRVKKPAALILSAIMEGACLGNHLFDRYKKEKKLKPLKKISLFVTGPMARKHSRLTTRIEAICKGTMLAREWVSTPSNHKKPAQFAKTLSTLAARAKLKVRVLDDQTLKRQKFGAMLAVGAGSRSKPRLVIMQYNSRGAEKTVVLVGKGVTFDSGGINLKSSGSLENMKADMAGAAAVAGTMLALAELKPSLNVVGVMPLVENMPSGEATRPGDIIKTYAGKTVEIGNTDAEGRLILIDAMAYAVKKYKPDTLIDLATLTGACVVALGEKIAGVFSPQEDLSRAIVEAGKTTHERCWPLPLPEDYRKLMKSEVADLNNISSSRSGGAVTAALFLSEFVGDTRWAHIDIAGPSYIKKADAYCSAGGTGFGVRLLCEVLAKL